MISKLLYDCGWNYRLFWNSTKRSYTHQRVECMEAYTAGLCESPLFTCNQYTTVKRTQEIIPPCRLCIQKGLSGCTRHVWMTRKPISTLPKVYDVHNKNKSKQQETEVTIECAPLKLIWQIPNLKSRNIVSIMCTKIINMAKEAKVVHTTHTKKCFRFVQNDNE